MSDKLTVSTKLLVLTCIASMLSARPAIACSVCFGDPNSPMSQGVEAGILFLLGVLVIILLLMSSVLVFWIRRATRLADPAESRETGGA
ncbi:MAG: hypothetical protein ABGX04_19450 [Myxococcales bacterium]|nr:hypothetical protein [Myxococcales bacterium]HIM02337.1 hypothetical protein [Myxococcales bacterium]